VGWSLTDGGIGPRLKAAPVGGDTSQMPTMEKLEPAERRGLTWSVVAMAIAIGLFILTLLPEGTPWAADPATLAPGTHPLLAFTAPLMQSIVALIFIFFLIPGVVYGYVAGTAKSHR